MRGNRRILFLVLIMTGVAIGVGRIALYVLYQAAFDQQRGRLVEVAQSQARLLEAVARFNSQHYGAEHTPEEAFDVVLSQMRDAHERFRGFGETGEFTLAKLEGDQIIFLLRHRHYDLDNPEPVSFSSTDIAEPMRRALAGESGTVVGLDYRGEKVLAAYEYVAELNLGIVAKVDLAELRQPFINAALLAGGVGLGFVFLGSILFWRVSTPLLRHIEENEKRYRAVFEQAADAIVLIDVETGAIVEFNDRTCETLGYSREELQRLKLSDIEVIESTADEARPAQGGAREWANTVETKRRTKSGEVREILISARAISLHGKALVLQVWHDITERKQAEMALRESEERFRLLYEQAPLSYQALDERGHLIEVNQAWLDTLGYTREEVIGRWFGDFLTPESRVYLGEEFARFRTAGQTHARRWQGDSKHTDSNIRRQAVGRV